MKVIWKYVWPWFSRSTMEVRWHILDILTFQTSAMFKSTQTLCLYHVYNTWWTGNKYLWPWFSRSSFEVKWWILITARSVASNTMELTRRSNIYHIYNQKWRRSYNSQLDLDFFHVINFDLFKITDLELVRIDTKIKSVSCIQPKITKVIWKWVWPWRSRSNVKVR